MPTDKFGNPYFYPSKAGGFSYVMSDNPKNDNNVDWPSEMSFSGNIATMHPNGPTDFGVGKNISSFNDSIGGCSMDFKATAKRGYAYKADDARDIEYKCLMKVSGIGSNGFSISFCTGHHTGSSCCQGFAYMLTTEVGQNPTQFRFRKETVHVEYTNSPEGTFTHSKANFKIDGVGRFVGLGACRYNKPKDGGTSPQDDTVILEAWFNPNPDNDPSDWTMIKRIEDKPGKHWTGSPGKCNGDSDQIGPWSNAQNRMKTNASSGSIQFKAVTLREINPFGTFDEEPPGGGTGVQRWIKYSMVSGDANLEHYSEVTGHEIIETITDPDPLNTFGGQAWGNSAGKEVVDPCENLFFQYPDGLHVEAYWSNSDDRCVVPGLTVPDTVEVPSMTNRKGGAVLANAKIYLIYWGSDWKNRVTTPTSAEVTDLIQGAILDDDVQYFDKVSQYGCSAPIWGGAVFNTTFPIPGGNITEEEGRECIIDTFNKGLLPIPADTNEDVYVLYVPVGKDIIPMGSSSTPGGFHDIWHPVLVPPVVTCPTGFHKNALGVCVPDTVSCPAGQHENELGVCVDNDIPPVDPNPPSKVVGTFTLLRDINISRTDACEGTSGGGGSGGSAIFFGPVASTFDRQLSNTSAWSHRTRCVVYLKKSGAEAIGKILKQFDIPLKKVGSPAATPTVSAVIWSPTGTVVYTSPTLIDPTTLTTSFVNTSFDFSANIHVFVVGDRVGIKYFPSDVTADVNYVVCAFDMIGEGNTTMMDYESSVWKEHLDRDLSCTLWQ